MSLIHNELFIHPLYHDAISGEFKPSTDPQERMHTLGRLVVATFAKGAQLIGSEQFARFSYSPSWDHAVRTTIHCDIDPNPDHKTSRHFLNGILLEDKISRRRLEVFDASNNLRNEVLIRQTNKYNNTYSINLGDELNNTRQYITQAAQEFFDHSD